MFGIELSWHIILFGVLTGFFVGMLTGFFGAGGGFIITPMLNVFMGLPMNLAVGTSACQVLGASTFSLWHHFDRRLLGIRVAICAGIGIPLGTWLGATVVQRLKFLEAWTIGGKSVSPVDIVLLTVFAVFLLAIGAWMFYDGFFRRHAEDAAHVGYLYRLRIPPLYKFRTISAGPFSIPVLVMLGLFMGFMGGLLGIGGGVIMLPALFYLIGQETKYAAYVTTILIFCSGAFSTFFHALDHNIDYPLAAALVSGAFFGARCGAILQKKTSGKSIRRYFAFVVLAAWLLVIYKLIRIFYT